MRGPKILAVASAVDLDFRYGCTPAWWQLWKGLHEEGVDLVVTPYRGRPVESPWWRTAPNPTYVEGESFARARDAFARLKGDTMLRRAEDNPETGYGDRMTRELIWRWVTPRWRRHLERLVERRAPRRGRRLHGAHVASARDPVCLARAVRRAGALLRRRRADEPARVRRHGHRLQLVPRRRSVGVRRRALELRGRARAAARARRAARPRPSSGAPTPSSSPRRTSTRRSDVFFYGYGDKFRRDWMEAMVGEPSRRLPDVDFALGGRDFRGDTGNARLVGDVPFNVFPRAISAARINLCITRRSHASVYASSLVPPVRARVVRRGDRLEPVQRDRALVRAGLASCSSSTTPTRRRRRYRNLLDDPGQAEELGRRAHERVLDEHTYRHRARRLLSLIGLA